MMISSSPPFQGLAVVGMDVTFAACDDLDTFEKIIYEAGQQFPRQESGPSATSYTGVPALEKVTLRALQDAGYPANQLRAARIAVLLAGAAGDPLSLPWAAVVQDLSALANPLVDALEYAQAVLSRGEADAVVFAAASSLFKLPADSPIASVNAMGFDREVHGWRLGEGAGAVVWMRSDQAFRESRRAYAVIRSLAGIGPKASENGASAAVLPVPPALDDVRACIRAALEQAQVTPDQIGYVEVFGSGNDTLDGIEIAGLAQSYRLPEQDLTTAIGSVQANAGYLGAASGLLGLIRSAMCLYHRFFPAVPGWSTPKLPALWRNAPFYLPVESRTWFTPDFGPGRMAALDVVGLGGSFAHLVLAESGRQELHPNRVLAQSDFHLIPIAADSLDGLLEQLEDLQQALMFAPGLSALAAEWHAAAAAHPDAAYGLAILGHNHEELLNEVGLALKSVPAAFEKRVEWQTPLGSCFVPEPVGRQGEVAFVYPGAFNSYPWVAKDLFRLFPWLHLKPVGRTVDLGHIIRERMLYPRCLTAPCKEDQAQHEARLLSEPIAMLTSGTAIAILFTYILEEAFQIRPAAAFGYSLGENSMLFASGIWQEGDAVTEVLETSALFHSRLAGPQNAIREHWGLPTLETADEQPLWNNYLLMAPVERVYQALEAEPRVYITHINTPRQVVIGGDPAACQRVITALRCSSLQAPFDYALHCEAMASEFDELAGIHDWPVERQTHMRLYSAADYNPVHLDRKEIAQRVAKMLSSSLDFPRLVRRVYEDGARVFIEAGAGSNCARWIDESLKGEPHLAVSINRRGTDDQTSLVRTLAKLYSHRVPMDLSPLYQSAIEKVSL